MTISFFFHGISRTKIPWKWNQQMSAQPGGYYFFTTLYMRRLGSIGAKSAQLDLINLINYQTPYNAVECLQNGNCSISPVHSSVMAVPRLGIIGGVEFPGNALLEFPVWESTLHGQSIEGGIWLLHDTGNNCSRKESYTFQTRSTSPFQSQNKTYKKHWQ
jgi:hypothetical protein